MASDQHSWQVAIITTTGNLYGKWISLLWELYKVCTTKQRCFVTGILSTALADGKNWVTGINLPPYHITNSLKYERGFTYTRRHKLHWLNIPERIQFRIAVTAHRCLNGLAPAYLTKLCTPVTQNRSSCCLRSSYCHRLAVPSVELSIGFAHCTLHILHSIISYILSY